MDVGFLTERMLPGLGVDRLVYEYSKNLKKFGNNSFIHASITDPDLVPSNIKVKTLPPIRSRRPPVQDLWAIENLPSLSANKNTRWILSTPPYFALTPFLEHSTILHGGTTPHQGLSLKGAAVYYWREFTQNMIYYPFATKIIVLSEFLMQGLPKVLQDKAEIINPGWDHYPKKTESASLEMKKFLTKDCQKTILYMGRLNTQYQPYKGLLNLINMVKEMPFTKLVCSGYGDENDVAKLESLGVTVFQNHPSKEMGNLIGAVDAVVMASEWEGYGLPAAEAQYQGTPVVALDRGALQEVVENNTTGFLVDDFKEMKKKIEQLFLDKKLYEEFSVAGVERSKIFTWEKSSLQLEEFINSR